MILLFPLLCLPLGLSGIVPAFLIGILADQILLIILVSHSVRRIVSGNPLGWKIWHLVLDEVVISELCLLVVAHTTIREGMPDLKWLRGWLDDNARHSRLIFPQHSRIW